MIYLVASTYRRSVTDRQTDRRQTWYAMVHTSGGDTGVLSINDDSWVRQRDRSTLCQLCCGRVVDVSLSDDGLDAVD